MHNREARWRSFGNLGLIGAINSWMKKILIMSNLIDPDLVPQDELKEIKDQCMDWDNPVWVKEWLEAGHTEGRAEGRENSGAFQKSLYRQAGSRFDSETVERLTKHLDQIFDPKLLLEISW